MHDIDRTTMEYSQEMNGFEGEQFEFDQEGEGEWGQEGGYLSEQDEMEFANELLNVSSEAELDQFLGSLIKKVGSVAGKVIRSPIGQAIGGALKGVAKKALPLAGGAIGGYFGGPLGAKMGSGLAKAAGSAIGLEGEMGEDQEYEGARTFVRMAADTVQKAAQAGAKGDPRQLAQRAVMAAARQHAPGLLQRAGMMPQGGQRQGMRQSGRWTRQGNRIILHGA